MFPKSLPSPNNTNIQKHVQHNRGSEIATAYLLRNMFIWRPRGDAYRLGTGFLDGGCEQSSFQRLADGILLTETVWNRTPSCD